MSGNISQLPARPSLEQLQRQAKELLKQFHAGVPAALNRFLAVSGRPPCLADAQYVLAREYGFEDWAKLKRQISIMRVSGPIFLSSKPPFYTIDWFDSSIHVEGHQTVTDWDAVFSAAKELKIAKLTARAITDEALARLPELTQIRVLNIAGANQVTNAGLRHLARMPHLQELELGGGGSTISDTGFQVLRHLVELKRLQACWTPGLSDRGVVGLTNSIHLEDVNLLGTSTGDGAIQALSGKPHIRRFQSGLQTTDRGLALLCQFPVFKTWQGGDLKYGLMSADAQPNFLLIDGPFTDRGLASLAGLDGLFALSLFWHTPGFTSQGLAALKDLPNLGFLGCQSDHCDDEAMRWIASFPRLRMLMGQGAVATDAGFEALSRSETIEFIWGRECPNLTGRGFSALAGMPNLRGLAVSCRNVDDAALAQLPDFPSLREFMPMDVSDSGFRHIGDCENLEALWCMYCRNTGDEATGHIADLSKLTTYYAGKTGITDRSLEILSRMRSLERLEFHQCAGVTDQGVDYLRHLPKLQEISLEGLPHVSRQAANSFPASVRVQYVS